MKYIVIHSFKDLQDDNYIYQVGDFYPRKDIKEISDKRIEELSGVNNKIGKSLIKAIEIEVKSEGEKVPEPESEGEKAPEPESEGEKAPEPEVNEEKTPELSEKPKTNKKDKNK